MAEATMDSDSEAIELGSFYFCSLAGATADGAVASMEELAVCIRG